MRTIFTIGHSNHPAEYFIALLKSFGIETLADIRAVPQSRYNPQFGQKNLASILKDSGIDYLWLKNLGGKRPPDPDSPNTAFRPGGGFQGYADYMQTGGFQKALQDLVVRAGQTRTAIMCAESDPSQCHRSLVSDALVIRDIEVQHIRGIGQLQIHTLNENACLQDDKILYVSKAEKQGRLF